MTARAPWSAQPDGLVVTVRLTPKGGRDSIDGIETMSDGQSVLKARVRAAPQKRVYARLRRAMGEANAALGRLLAKALGVPPSRAELVGGATSRIKRVKISGDAASLAAALEKIAR